MFLWHHFNWSLSCRFCVFRVLGGPTLKSWTVIWCATSGGSSTTTPKPSTHLWWLKTYGKAHSTCCRCVCLILRGFY